MEKDDGDHNNNDMTIIHSDYKTTNRIFDKIAMYLNGHFP